MASVDLRRPVAATVLGPRLGAARARVGRRWRPWGLRRGQPRSPPLRRGRRSSAQREVEIQDARLSRGSGISARPQG
eukprot:4908651-Pyramimonas_sp.AAC.1